jgi:hypothetical protein
MRLTIFLGVGTKGTLLRKLIMIKAIIANKIKAATTKANLIKIKISINIIIF